MIINRTNLSKSESYIHVTSLDNNICDNERSINDITEEVVDEKTLSIINMAIINYYLVNGKDISKYRKYTFLCHKNNDPRYYEMIANRLVSSKASLFISKNPETNVLNGIMVYKNKTGTRIVEETSQKIAFGNYLYSEIVDNDITTLVCTNDVILYFDHNKTDIAALVELERAIDIQKMKFTDLNVTVNTKNAVVSSHYSRLLLYSFN